MLTATMIDNKIAEKRKKLNISQGQLAQHLSIYGAQAVGKWEREFHLIKLPDRQLAFSITPTNTANFAIDNEKSSIEIL
jgi:DNA-binding XRE family transcriptional regulator